MNGEWIVYINYSQQNITVSFFFFFIPTCGRRV